MKNLHRYIIRISESEYVDYRIGKKQHNIMQNVVNHKVVCGNFHDLIDISCSPNPAAAFAPYNNYVLLGSLKEGHSHLIFTTLFPPQV